MTSTLIALLIQIITFAAVVAVSMAVIGRVTTQMDVRRRLKEQVSVRPIARTGLLKKDGVTNPFLLWVQRATALTESKDGQQLRRDLSKAGIEHPAAPALYVISRFALAIGLPLAF